MNSEVSTCHKPLLIVVSAPSGGGKTTLCDRLLAERPDIAYSVSCTTRSPRGQEVSGTDYYFVTEAEFRELVEQGKFLEYAPVHGNLYGTLRQTVQDAFERGHSVLMDIDVEGARQVREAVVALAEDDPLRVGHFDIFISPPSLEVLRGRLESRGEDEQEVVERRMQSAAEEMAAAHEYSYRLVNEHLETACAQLSAIVEKEGVAQ